MKQFTLVRYGFGRNSTLGYIAALEGGDERRICYSLEDERRETKVPGETCIPVGSYEIKLRTEGGLHSKYSARFGDRHKGMLWLQNVPGFEWVYIHIGNEEDDTEGCPLTGSTPMFAGGLEFKVGGSTDAYWKVYEEMVPALIAGERVMFHVTEIQPWA